MQDDGELSSEHTGELPNQITVKFLKSIKNSSEDDNNTFLEFMGEVHGSFKNDDFDYFDLRMDLYLTLAEWYNKSGKFRLNEDNRKEFVGFFKERIHMVMNIDFQTVPYRKDFTEFDSYPLIKASLDEVLLHPDKALAEQQNRSIKNRNSVMLYIEDFIVSGTEQSVNFNPATNSAFDEYTSYLKIALKNNNDKNLWLTEDGLKSAKSHFEEMYENNTVDVIIQTFFDMRQGCATHVDQLITKLGTRTISHELMVELSNWHNRYAVFALHDEVYGRWKKFFNGRITHDNVKPEKYVYLDSRQKTNAGDTMMMTGN